MNASPAYLLSNGSPAPFLLSRFGSGLLPKSRGAMPILWSHTNGHSGIGLRARSVLIRVGWPDGLPRTRHPSAGRARGVSYFLISPLPALSVPAKEKIPLEAGALISQALSAYGAWAGCSMRRRGVSGSSIVCRDGGRSILRGAMFDEHTRRCRPTGRSAQSLSWRDWHIRDPDLPQEYSFASALATFQPDNAKLEFARRPAHPIDFIGAATLGRRPGVRAPGFR